MRIWLRSDLKAQAIRDDILEGKGFLGLAPLSSVKWSHGAVYQRLKVGRAPPQFIGSGEAKIHREFINLETQVAPFFFF